MRADAVEVPRTLADTEKTMKLILLKATIKLGSIVKIRKSFNVFHDCTITYRKLYRLTTMLNLSNVHFSLLPHSNEPVQYLCRFCLTYVSDKLTYLKIV